MKNWEVKKLGDVCSFFNGQAHEKVIDESGKYKLINSKFVSSEGEKFKRTNNALSPLFINDIVMVMSDVPNGKTLAKCFVVDKDDTYTLNQRICVIRSKNFDTRFLYYQLNRNKYLLSFNNGENQSNLRKDDILNCELFVPPLPEQQRIVAILDEAFSAIAKAKANAEQNLKNTKELFESYLQEVFDPSTRSGQGNKGEGWEVKAMGAVCEVMNGGTPDTTVSKFWNGEHLWITPKDMGKMKGIYVDNTLRKITDDGLKNSSAKILPPNSIILSSRAPIGHLAINTKPISTNQGCKGLVPKKGVDTLFLYYFLYKSVDLLNSLGTGTTFKELSGSKLTTVIIPIPSLKAQQIIVKKLDALSAETKKLEAIYNQKINDLEELKKSVLQKAFAGELCRTIVGS